MTPDSGYNGLTEVRINAIPSPMLQNKSVEITENGTTNVTPDTGYDGLSSVAVDVKVNGPILPNQIKFYYSYCTDMGWLSQVDTSQITTISGMFQSMQFVTYVPIIDTSNVLDASSCFNGDSNLETLPAFDLSKVTSISNFASSCVKLKNVPIYNLSSIDNGNTIQNMFLSCPLLTNESLNNILATCMTMTNITRNPIRKNLKYIGLNQTQAETCTTLSNWSALEQAGWTSGY